MAGLNKAMLIGHLGRAPEVRAMSNGDKVASFSLATSESWRDRSSGEKRERTEWHNVVIFNEHLVKVAEQYLRKGSKVYVEGQLRTRKWQHSDGGDRWSTEVVLGRYDGTLQLLDKADGAGRPAPDPDSYGSSSGGAGGAGAGKAAGTGAGGGAFGADAPLDDDIPF